MTRKQLVALVSSLELVDPGKSQSSRWAGPKDGIGVGAHVEEGRH